MRASDIDDVYLHGLCASMAVTLHKRLGGEVVGIFDVMWDTRPRHVGIKRGDTYADARGLHLTADEFMSGYDVQPGTHIEPVNVYDLKQWFSARIKDFAVPEDELMARGLIEE